MIAWLKGIWTIVRASSWMASAIKIGGLVVAGLLAILVVLGKARQAGRDAERVRNADATIKRVEKANEAEREVRDAADRGKRPPERVRKFYID